MAPNHLNASSDGGPVRVELQSQTMVLIDPLALDGLREELQSVAAAPHAEKPHMLRALAAQGLRIGLQELPALEPGAYELDADAFEPVDASDPHPGVFECDSGAVIIIDLEALSAASRVLTWDRYDDFLQSPPGDDSRLMAINDEVGGPRFAIISADASRGFSGDGAFRLKPDRIVRAP